jgi:transcription elongation factor GreA
MEKVPMTPAGHAALREELTRLRSVERPAIVQAIGEAREHGDLGENAEYHAAKDRQGFIEARIKDIESKLALAEVIDPAKLAGTTKVAFGATVKLSNSDTDEEVVYRILGQDEADLTKGSVSISSPIARALLGKEEGDEVTVRSPSGERKYEILSVEFK